MHHVFLLQHVRTLPDRSEDVKCIGVYSSESLAIQAAQRLAPQPGFRDHPHVRNPVRDDEGDGFFISKLEVDRDHWTEGFVSV